MLIPIVKLIQKRPERHKPDCRAADSDPRYQLSHPNEMVTHWSHHLGSQEATLPVNVPIALFVPIL